VLRIAVSLGAKMDANKKFALSISDVSVGGVPLPNAWLGNLKGLNMFADSSVGEDPAFQAFAAGIRDFSIRSGQLSVVLNE
jgi:arginine N-succinyltransferase